MKRILNELSVDACFLSASLLPIGLLLGFVSAIIL